MKIPGFFFPREPQRIQSQNKVTNLQTFAKIRFLDFYFRESRRISKQGRKLGLDMKIKRAEFASEAGAEAL